MLLAGIKAGKKKKKKSSSGIKEQDSSSSHAAGSSSSSKPPPSGAAALPAPEAAPPATAGSLSANESLAEQLRQSFRQGKAILPVVVQKPSDAVMVSLEDRGRILLEGKPRAAASLKRGDDDDDEQKEVIIMGATAGSLKNKQKSDQDLTIADMVAQERLFGSTTISQNEATAREIMRMNKRRKIKKNVDSDEEEERQLKTIGIVKAADDSNGAKAAAAVSIKPPTARRQERQEQRQEQALQQRAMARHDAQEQVIAKCWWWIEAKLSFQRHRLLALGNYVSLVMTPIALSLVPGRHFYLVPIRHAPCLLACDDEVWQEIRHFQASLRNMYAAAAAAAAAAATRGKNKMAVIFTETVLSTSSFWQTRMECMVVPTEVALDAPLYFKNSMLEQAEEWGTHSHKIYNINHEKTLVQTLPSKASNLAYFYIDFGSNNGNANNNATTTTGYAQVIESSRFPKDFAADTVAGMMHLDPMRLRRGRKPPPPPRGGQKGGGGGVVSNANNNAEEQDLIRTFLQEWKDYDWTLQLDDGS